MDGGISQLTLEQQVGGLGVLELLSGLFTESGKDTFTREEVLVLLDDVRSMPALFDEAMVIAFEEA